MVEDNVVDIRSDLESEGAGDASWGSDLIHAPHDPSIEEALVDLYLAHHVTRVSASAFMRLTPAVVRYAYSGLAVRPDGSIHRPNLLFAKLSRSETAQQFMAPAPAEILSALVARGALTAAEAEVGARVAVAEDITVEADSGGHTDNRPPTAVAHACLRCAATAWRQVSRVRSGWARPAASAPPARPPRLSLSARPTS